MYYYYYYYYHHHYQVVLPLQCDNTITWHSGRAYCSLRNEMERNEMKQNEMEICSLRNGNL